MADTSKKPVDTSMGITGLFPRNPSEKDVEFGKFKQALKDGDKPGMTIEHAEKLLKLDSSFSVTNKEGLQENVFTVFIDQYLTSEKAVEQLRLFYAILKQWGGFANVEPGWETFVRAREEVPEAEMAEQEAIKNSKENWFPGIENLVWGVDEAKKAVADANAKLANFENNGIYTLKLLRAYVNDKNFETPVSLVYLGLLMSRIRGELQTFVIQSEEWAAVRRRASEDIEVLNYLLFIGSDKSIAEVQGRAANLYSEYRKKLLYGNQDDWMFTETATIMADLRPALRRKLEFLQDSGGGSANLLSKGGNVQEKFVQEGMRDWSVEFSKRSVRATVRVEGFDSAEKNPTDVRAEDASVLVEKANGKSLYVATSTSQLLRSDADAVLLDAAVLQLNDALVTLKTLFLQGDYYFSIERLVYDVEAEKAKVEADKAKAKAKAEADEAKAKAKAEADEAKAKYAEATTKYIAARAEVLKLFGPGNEEKLEFRGKAYRDRRVNQEFDKLSKLLEIVRNLSFKYPGINLEAEKAEIKKQEDWLEKYRGELIKQYDMVAEYDKTYKEFIKLLKPSYSIDADNIANRRKSLEEKYQNLVQQRPTIAATWAEIEPDKKEEIEEQTNSLLETWKGDFERASAKYIELEERARTTAEALYEDNKDGLGLGTYDAAAPGPDLDALLADHATSMRRVRDLLETD